MTKIQIPEQQIPSMLYVLDFSRLFCSILRLLILVIIDRSKLLISSISIWNGNGNVFF